MKRVTVYNEKGGSGKTTATLFLASWLASRGHRVLVIDFDSPTFHIATMRFEETASLMRGGSPLASYLRAIGSIPDWHGMDLDCLTYWIRHAALPQKKRLDTDSAANLVRWMLTEVIDCCPKGRSARTAEALRKEFEEMVKIDRSASGVSDTWHREAADWIFRANQAVEESGMDMDRFRERLRNMTHEHGGKFTSSQMSHPILPLLMTALGRSGLSTEVSKHMHYIKSCQR